MLLQGYSQERVSSSFTQALQANALLALKSPKPQKLVCVFRLPLAVLPAYARQILFDIITLNIV